MKLSRREVVSGGAVAAIALMVAPRMATAKSSFPVSHTDSEWKKILGAQRYDILREAGTERPFSSPLDDEHRKELLSYLEMAAHSMVNSPF